jgi:hypothetical protein
MDPLQREDPIAKWRVLLVVPSVCVDVVAVIITGLREDRLVNGGTGGSNAEIARDGGDLVGGGRGG